MKPHACTLCVVLVFCCSHESVAANVDFSHAIVYQAVQQGEHFGFTVALLRDTPASWVVVGAPNALKSSNFVRNDSTPGKVYACGLKKGCSEIRVQIKESSFNSNSTHELNDHAMLGSTLDVRGNVILVCAPRSAVLDQSKEAYRLFGACFASTTGLNGTYEKLVNLRGRDTTYVSVHNKSLANYVYGQAGFSGLITHDNGLLVGAPGLFAWSGGTIEYNNHNKKLASPTITTARGAFQVTLSALLGFAVTSGKYFNDKKYLFASSAPRDVLKDFSQVIIFDRGNDNATKVKTCISSEGISKLQPGEMFGHSLASGDFNGDGLDEILIGAPFFSAPAAADQGRVFIYTKDSPMTMKLWVEVSGEEEGARFGFTVASLLHIDSDHFCDFAVGAPYASGGGAVFIYTGAKEGPKLLKKIIGHQFSPSMQGFGFSFSRPVDVDNNQVNDFAIGAYKSGHVVVLRGRPAADVNVTIALAGGEFLSHTTTDLQATLILQTISNMTVEITEIEFKITVRPNNWKFAATNSSSLEGKFNISNEESIVNFRLNTELVNFEKEPQPLQVEAEVVVAEEQVSHLIMDSDGQILNGTDVFSKLKPIFRHPTYSTRVEREYTPSCNASCKTQYTIKITLGTPGEKLYRESSTSIRVHVTVEWKGDRVGAQLRMRVHPPSAHLQLDRPFTADADGDLVTNVAPSQNRSYHLWLKVDEETLLDENAQVTLSASISSKQSASYASVSQCVTLHSNASLNVVGYSEESTFEKHKKNLTVNYFFEVEREGQSPLRRVKVLFDVPVAYKKYEFSAIAEVMAKTGVGSHFETPLECRRRDSQSRNFAEYKKVLNVHANSTVLVNRTLQISCEGREWKCVTLECDLSRLLVQDSRVVQIKLQITFTPPKIEGKKMTLLLGVHARVEIVEPRTWEAASKNATSKVTVFAIVNRQFDESLADIDLWIIVAAVVSAIVALLALITLLKKCGFFKRDMKNELIALKRQTSSIMPMLGNQSLLTPDPVEEESSQSNIQPF